MGELLVYQRVKQEIFESKRTPLREFPEKNLITAASGQNVCMVVRSPRNSPKHIEVYGIIGVGRDGLIEFELKVSF